MILNFNKLINIEISFYDCIVEFIFYELLKLKIGKRKYIKINANRSPDIIHQEIISHLTKCKLI